MVDDFILKEVESTKFLGMRLDRGLTWNAHIASVCAKLGSGIFAFRNIKILLPTSRAKGQLWPCISTSVLGDHIVGKLCYI